MRVYEKMIEQCKKMMDRYVTGRLWIVVAYDKHKTFMGKSDSFKFIKKRLSWCAPHLILHIKKKGRITSVFMVSGKMRWDITKNVKGRSLYARRHRCGEELDIDDLIISIQTY